MLKFFRKIRQESIKNHKTINYLKYAIGEIILVVIGILIALQVNEWNNDRIRKKEEVTILKQLQTDLKTSQTELSEIKTFYLVRAKASAEVLRAYWKNEVPNDSINYSLNRPKSSRIYSPVLGTFRSLINSGNIDKISSDSIKNELVSYLEKVEYTLKDINRYEETYYRNGVKKVNEILPVPYRSMEEFQMHKKRNNRNSELGLNSIPDDVEKIPFPSNLKEIFQNKEIFVAYDNLHIAHRNVYNSYDEILTLTEELLQKIEKELRLIKNWNGRFQDEIIISLSSILRADSTKENMGLSIFVLNRI